MTGLPVRCVGLRHVYRLDDEKVIALDGIDLDLEAGSTTAIMGPSGSGKSTLMTLLAGLQRPSSGSIVVGDLDLAALSQTALLRVRAEQVGVVVQDPARNLLPYVDAAANVGFAQRGPRSYGRHDLPDAAQLLADVGLSAFVGVPADRLSGGERQRLAFAVGMAGGPGLLLADEPTSQLDVANRDQIVELMRELSAGYGVTVVAVTHDPAVADGLDRQVTLHEGRLVPDGAR